ncbi:DUF6114 domain-containing protein [Kitasatospora sp. CM 4170]|uniref:DUF6114 domain-containing protein n=1 Tax=Kitasatospora aburaviensis TaxID=67265 RepID=A0ABW1EZ18_9ACTN|nr:DUF6114 domain-containing protein [Kitasatospora sp. CM 4170]WNM47742.1 DUF6114 domain-containing protein [Kitasatospora sp. CM 4170]
MSSALAELRPADHENPVQWVRRVFRNFRRSRPFYGGLLAMFAGVPIMYFPYAKLSLNGMTVAMATTAGAGSLIIGILLIVLGLTAWFQSAVRIFAGVATMLLTLVSIPVSNLSGFGMSLLPGLIGGGLMVAWAPNPVAAEPAAATAAEAVAVDAATAETVAAAPVAEATAARAATAGAAPAEAATAQLPAVPGQGERPVLDKAPTAEGTVPRQQGGDVEEAR